MERDKCSCFLVRAGTRRSYAPDVDPSLATQIVARSTRPESPDHGEQHWKAVAWTGLGLAPQTEGCDAELVLTIAVCWDADRLNLWRVYITPDPRLLSTKAARDPELIAKPPHSTAVSTTGKTCLPATKRLPEIAVGFHVEPHREERELRARDEEQRDEDDRRDRQLGPHQPQNRLHL